MRVQDFLRNGGTPQALKEQYAINFNRHGEFPNLVLFKYNQIDSPMAEPIVQECRGLVLDEANNWDVVSHPFDKFFNEAEGHADRIGDKFVVQEKVDGSLCVLYFYKDRWYVQTSGSPDASGQVHAESNMKFADLFWGTWKRTGFVSQSWLDPNINYIFELTSQYNRIVVWHTEPRLTLIGARDRTTQKEIEASHFSKIFPVVREFSLDSMADVLDTFASMDPMKQEGYVLRGQMKDNGSFARVKLKHPGYVAIHHMRDRLTDKAMLEVLRTGEASEFLRYFPEATGQFNAVKSKYEDLVHEIESMYATIKHIKVQKDFAIQANKTRMPGAMFNLRNGKSANARSYLADIRIKSLMQTLGLKDEEETDNRKE